jgi:TRAP-type mannitol/chloroaromatic compound transport system permease small subunit
LRLLLRLSRGIDWLNGQFGMIATWLVLIACSLPERGRLWIDIVGGLLFLIPICVILIYFTWPWFVQSWNIHETSPNAGGLVRWPVKLLLPVGFGLMILQGISEIIKRVAALLHVIDDDFAYEKPLQ